MQRMFLLSSVAWQSQWQFLWWIWYQSAMMQRMFPEPADILVYARLGPHFSKLSKSRHAVHQPSQIRPASIAAGETFSFCRMGRSDVVARMLIELLDEDCMKAVVEALAGLRTEEAIQAVVQVSLTLASADRPDVIADVSVPSLPVPPILSLCRVLTQLTRHWGRMIRYLDCIAAALAAGIQRSAHTRQWLCGLLRKEVRCMQSKGARLWRYSRAA